MWFRQANPGAYRDTSTHNGYNQKNPVLAAVLSLIIVGLGKYIMDKPSRE